MAVHITTGYPSAYGDERAQLKNVQGVLTGLIDNIEWALCHLDAGNVIEAASVKAQNIDTTQAKIGSAQIKNLTADKVQAGTIDLSKGITIEGTDGLLEISDNFFSMRDAQGRTRFEMGTDEAGQFAFVIYSLRPDAGGGNLPAVYLDDEGDAVFSGKVTASEIEGSHITADTSIDITEDVRVGANIYLTNGHNLDEGIHFKQDKTASIVLDDPAGLLRVTSGLAVNGTLSTLKGLYVGGVDLVKRIDALEARIAALEGRTG